MAGNWRLLSSVVLGTMIAGAILSATIIYSDAIRDLGLDFALEQRDPTKLDVTVFRSTQTINSSDYQRSEEVVNRAVTSALSGTFAGLVREGSSATFYPVAPGALPDLYDDTRARGNLLFRSDLEPHVRIVEGVLPQPVPPDYDLPVPAAIGLQTAELSGLALGATVDLYPFWDNEAAPLTVMIVGIIEALDPGDRYWSGDPNAIDAPTRSWGTYFVHIPESTFFGLLPARFPQIVADYNGYYEVDLGIVNARNALPIADALAGLARNMNATEERTSSRTELIEVLRTFDEKLFFTRIPLFVLLLQIGGIVAYYLVMVSTMLTERQTAEIATLRSRGATTGQLLAQYGIEGVILAAIALVTGPPIAATVISALGPTPAFAALSGGGPLEVRISVQSFVLAGIGALIAFGALVIPAWFATRTTVVEFKRNSARPKPTPAFLRYYLDVALVLVVALVFWRLSQQDQLFTESLFGETQADPFLLATPAVFMVTVGIVFLRIFPLLLGVIDWLVGWTRSVAAAVSVRSLVRNPTHYTRLVLLLMFATGVGTFGATFSATLDRSYTERADYQVGADVRALDLRGIEGSNQALLEMVAAVPADDSMGVIRVGGSLEANGRFERAEVIGVQPDKFSDIAFWREDFSNTSLGDITATLMANEPPLREGIALPVDARQIGIWVKAPDLRGGVSLTIFLRGADGIRGEYQVASIRPRDPVAEEWLFYSTSLLQQRSRNGRPLVAEPLVTPITIESVLISTYSRIAAADGTVLFGPLITTDAAVPFETPSVVAGISSESFANGQLITHLTDPRYEPIEGQRSLPSGDQLLESTDAPPGVDSVARLQWSAGQLAPRLHGIRERLDPTPVQFYVSSEAAERLELRPGDALGFWAFSRFHEGLFAGTFDLFPSYLVGDRSEALVLVNANRLLQSAEAAQSDHPSRFTEFWLATSDRDATVEALAALGATTIHDAESTLLEQQEDPLVAAGWNGILAISFGTVLLLSAIGFLVYSYLSAQQRGLEFAILRTLGFSRVQVFTTVFVEQSFIVIAGMGLGTIVGFRIGRIMMDFLGTNERGDNVLPPFVLAVSWPEIFVVWGILGAVFVVTIAAVVLLYLRLAVHRALRIGDA
jgi:ABC-type lipoprotein release transport system permease subunit